jgi:hypothetical protein
MTNMNLPKRYALVRGHGITAAKVAAYLPRNYTVEGVAQDHPFKDDYAETVVVIGGRDDHGWTLHDYVIPRLGSGLMGAVEIDLGHPVMMQLPAWPEREAAS